MMSDEPTHAELVAATLDLLRAQALGFDIDDPAVVRTVVDANKRARAEADQAAAARLAAAKEAAATGATTRSESVVYYMRVGNRVKIGYSTNLAGRLATVMPEELLATEPGGRMLEDVRHRQFASLRVTREWFRLEGALAEHIETLRGVPCTT